jgi:hypothetical protein
MYGLNSKAESRLELSIACAIISGLSVIVRIYCKLRHKQGVRSDDYWIILGLLFYWVADAVVAWGMFQRQPQVRIQWTNGSREYHRWRRHGDGRTASIDSKESTEKDPDGELPRGKTKSLNSKRDPANPAVELVLRFYFRRLLDICHQDVHSPVLQANILDRPRISTHRFGSYGTLDRLAH